LWRPIGGYDDELRALGPLRNKAVAGALFDLEVRRKRFELDIIGGNFESRIAKYSLIEFASIMRVNDWEYSICCVN